MRRGDPDKRWVETRIITLVDELLRDASVLEIEAHTGALGALIVDCGVRVRGSHEAGRRLAVISHGGMMAASLGMCDVGGVPLAEMVCDSWRPPVSTVGLQVSFALHEVDPSIRISGPIRARVDAAVPHRSFLRRLVAGARDPWSVAVVEMNGLPAADAVRAVAERAGVEPGELTLLVAPPRSLAGVAHVAGRVNECVLFTLKESLRLDPDCAVSVLGAVPVAPAGPEAGLTQDDMIHYAGRVELIVDAPADWDLSAIAESLVFRSSPAYGGLFSELLAQAGGVFEAIPGLVDLNKVGEVLIIDRLTGRTASAGSADVALLASALRRAKEAHDGAR